MTTMVRKGSSVRVRCWALRETPGISRMVAGWAIDSSQTALLVTNALGMAVRRRTPDGEVLIHSDSGVQGGLNWSSQHVDRGGVDGQASWVDDGVDGQGTDEVSGQAIASSRRGAGVFGWDRQGLEQRGGCAGGRRVSGSGQPLVSRTWRYANVHACSALGSVSVVRGAGRDRDVQGSGRRGSGDRPAVGAFPVNELQGAAPQRGHSRREARLSRVVRDTEPPRDCAGDMGLMALEHPDGRGRPPKRG